MSTAEFSNLTSTLYQLLQSTDDYLDEIPTGHFTAL